METTDLTRTEDAVRIAANNAVTKRLGHWSTARRFQVRAHRGVAVVDLRSPRIPAGDIEVEVDLNHAVLKLLVADDAVIDDWDLRRIDRGKIKDGPGTQVKVPGRRIVVRGTMRGSEIRVHRSGVAILSAMFSRAYLADLRRAHRERGFPTVDDPTRTA
jgi:hypothetical protein